MGLETYAILAAAFLVAMATPGPGVAAVVSRALAFGVRRNLAFIAGMVLGDLVLLGMAIAGLAALASAFEAVFLLLKYAAAGYLIYLGVRMWRAPADARELPDVPARSGRREAVRGFVGGLLLTLSNPKTILFYMALLPAFVDLAGLGLTEGLTIAALVVGILTAVMLAYAMASSQARRLFRSPRAVRALNRTTGSVMIGAGVAVATR